MNIHKNARLTLARRLELVQDITVRGRSAGEAALAHGVTPPTARKWLGRFLALGGAALADASSRPALSPRAIGPAKALAIVKLRHKRLTQARIAVALGISKSTVGRFLARAFRSTIFRPSNHFQTVPSGQLPAAPVHSCRKVPGNPVTSSAFLSVTQRIKAKYSRRGLVDPQARRRLIASLDKTISRRQQLTKQLRINPSPKRQTDNERAAEATMAF